MTHARTEIISDRSLSVHLLVDHIAHERVRGSSSCATDADLQRFDNSPVGATPRYNSCRPHAELIIRCPAPQIEHTALKLYELYYVHDTIRKLCPWALLGLSSSQQIANKPAVSATRSMASSFPGTAQLNPHICELHGHKCSRIFALTCLAALLSVLDQFEEATVHWD